MSRVVIAAALLAACTACGQATAVQSLRGTGSAAVSGSTTSPAAPAPAVVRNAVRNVDGRITSAEWITTTTQHFAKIDIHIGPGAPDLPIYVVQMRGDFTISGFPVPGPSVPDTATGHVLLVTIPVSHAERGGGSETLSNASLDLAEVAPVHRLHVAPPNPVASCSSGFVLSLVPDRGGQSTPVAAAKWFAVHGGTANLPRSGWRQVSGSGGSATLAAGSSTLHAVEGPDHTWQVDSGHPCG